MVRQSLEGSVGDVVGTGSLVCPRPADFPEDLLEGDPRDLQLLGVDKALGVGEVGGGGRREGLGEESGFVVGRVGRLIPMGERWLVGFSWLKYDKQAKKMYCIKCLESFLGVSS